MATIPTETASFKHAVADLYGDRDPQPPPLTDRQIYRETVASVAASTRRKRWYSPAMSSCSMVAPPRWPARRTARPPTSWSMAPAPARTPRAPWTAGASIASEPRCSGACSQAFALAEERLAIQEEGASPEPAPPLPETPVPTSAAVLPEAPASVNFHTMLHGRQVQFTLRDSDEGRLVDRLEALMLRFPVEPVVPTTPTEGWCPIHQAAMKLNTKEGRTWYSHQVNGAWCKGRRT